MYALHSHSEGLPIGLLEGKAGANEVVAISIGNVPVHIGSENGRLVPRADGKSLSDAPRELIRHPDTVSAKGRKNRTLVEPRTPGPRLGPNSASSTDEC